MSGVRRMRSALALLAAAACAPADRAPADTTRDTARDTSAVAVDPAGAAGGAAGGTLPAFDTTAAATGALGPLLERPLGACAPVSGGSARDTLCYEAVREVDLAGDGRRFTLTVEARGPSHDSMAVQARIVRDDTTWYAAHWNTVLYGRYDAKNLPSASDTVRRRTTAQLARLLRDDAFLPVRAMLRGAQDPARTLRETLAFDVAEATVRARRGLTPADTLSRAQLDEVNASLDPAARDGGTDSPRVRALADELMPKLGWRFFRGGEYTSGVAWSERERRMVVAHSCC